ncbi:unnamed protein product [Paramecium pentaurelia]|uniref:Uncharacterized protein n=1 Tax=Paramecium pentaurelia TaxID=43138 RepID=A0A8S1T6Y1_9CILI|nr:unnamed protein product [Paramecium pentaurelia]
MEQMHSQYMTNMLRIMQYFSLFQSQFLNLSGLINQFVDFDIPNIISPNICSINSQEIFQLSISSYSQFYLKYNFSQDNMIDFTSINVYYNFQSYSLCDQIKLAYIKLSNYQSDLMIGQLMLCEVAHLNLANLFRTYFKITNLQYINQQMNCLFIANKKQINFTFSNQFKKFLTTF